MDCLLSEAQNVRFDVRKLKAGESLMCGGIAGPSSSVVGKSSLIDEIAQARKRIEKSLAEPPPKGISGSLSSGSDPALVKRVEALELQNNEMKQELGDLRATIKKLEAALNKAPTESREETTAKKVSESKPAAADDDDDDFELFGSDDEEEDAEAKRIKEEREKAYYAKKAASSKPAIIPKSNIILDVKPWDDETDMKEMEKLVRTIEMDGLVWGASKLVPVGYGIKKLQISCVVEDDKVSIDDLQEKIEENEDFVQSVDIAAFNKV